MSYFHLDGFLFFLLIGEFFAMLLKALFHRVRRWIVHVNYMTKRAGGTLLVDIEANYWLKKIKDPMYRAIWRWHFGNVWNQQHPEGTNVEKRKKRTLMKIAAAISAVLLISIALVAAFGVPNIVPGPVPTTTRMEVYNWANLSFVSQSNYTGWTFDLNGTALPFGNYSGGVAGLALGIARTDLSNSDATVFLNVTSGTFMDNGTATSYLYRAIYLVFGIDEMGNNQVSLVNLSGEDPQFGYLFTVPAHSAITLNLFLFFRAFDSTNYTTYVTIQPGFSEVDSLLLINGGYYRYNPYPCCR